MTGCYAKRVSLPSVLIPVCPIGISSQEQTVAELLKAGLRHDVHRQMAPRRPARVPAHAARLRSLRGPALLQRHGPRNRAGRMGDAPPCRRRCRRWRVEAPADQDKLVARYTEEAVKFITANKDRPFFLYLPHTAVHVPLHPGKAFQGKSANGRYGDWVEEVDWSCGRVLDTLSDLKLEPAHAGALHQRQRTLADPEARTAASAGPLRGGKARRGKAACASRPSPGGRARFPPARCATPSLSEIDVLPTLVKLAGGKVPADRMIDGKDIWPLLSGRTKQSPHEAHVLFQRQPAGSRAAPAPGSSTVLPRDRPCRAERNAVPAKPAFTPAAIQPRRRHRRDDRRGRQASRHRRAAARAISGGCAGIWALDFRPQHAAPPARSKIRSRFLKTQVRSIRLTRSRRSLITSPFGPL